MTGYRFDKVDANNPQQCIAFLDAAAAINDVQRIKQRSFDLLWLEKGQTVLDVGCGTGADVREMALLVGSTGQAIGVDSSQSMVLEARRRAGNLGLPVAFHHGDVYALPFENARFDGCRADRVLHFLENPEAALREMARVTVVGGRIVVSEPDWDTLEISGVDESLTAAILAGSKVGRFAPQSIGSSLPELFTAVGLPVKRVESASLEMRDLKTCMGLFNLEGAARRAAAMGRVTVEEAFNWLRLLIEAGRGGRLRCALSGQIVCGIKLRPEFSEIRR
jgi:SAM-dependent methyltransferase